MFVDGLENMISPPHVVYISVQHTDREVKGFDICKIILWIGRTICSLIHWESSSENLSVQRNSLLYAAQSPTVSDNGVGQEWVGLTSMSSSSNRSQNPWLLTIVI